MLPAEAPYLHIDTGTNIHIINNECVFVYASDLT